MSSFDQQYDEAQKVLAHLRGLEAHEGYQLLLEELRLEIRSRRNEVFGHRANSLDALIDLGAAQSELAGIQLAYNKLHQLIERWEGEAQVAQDELALEREES